MKLHLLRTTKTAKSTIGVLSIDGKRECVTLEDTVRPDGRKVYGETAIPTGVYEVQITQSPRFKRPLPLLLQVNGFVGVRIHPGNTPADTDGCILVGRTAGTDRIEESRVAFDALFAKLQAAVANKQTITLTVE